MRKVYIATQLQSQYDVAIALQLVQLSQSLSQSITVIVTYAANKLLVENIAKSTVINEVLQLDLPKGNSSRITAKNICSVIVDQDFILLSANNVYSQSILPGCAAILDKTYIENVCKIDESLHYIINNNGLHACLEIPGDAYIMTIAVSHFVLGEVKFGSAAMTKMMPCNLGVEKLSEVVTSLSYESDIILVGGRALGSRENFVRLAALARLMGADIGATLGAVTAGYAESELLVGVSGRAVTDKTYIGFGVSGAISHALMFADAKAIIAINNDSNAAILAVADYAVIIDVITAIEYFENIFKITKE